MYMQVEALASSFPTSRSLSRCRKYALYHGAITVNTLCSYRMLDAVDTHTSITTSRTQRQLQHLRSLVRTGDFHLDCNLSSSPMLRQVGNGRFTDSPHIEKSKTPVRLPDCFLHMFIDSITSVWRIESLPERTLISYWSIFDGPRCPSQKESI